MAFLLEKKSASMGCMSTPLTFDSGRTINISHSSNPDVESNTSHMLVSSHKLSIDVFTDFIPIPVVVESHISSKTMLSKLTLCRRHLIRLHRMLEHLSRRLPQTHFVLSQKPHIQLNTSVTFHLSIAFPYNSLVLSHIT